MKLIRIFSSIICLAILSSWLYSQDRRTTATKVADILAQFPARDNTATDKLMTDLLSLGEEGLRMVCDQIIPAGTGDDTRARFAIESLSRYLSQRENGDQKSSWEKICISYVNSRRSSDVRDFFMKQLQLVGSDASVEAVRDLLTDRALCAPALGVLESVGGKLAESVLAGSLSDKDLPCADAVMNVLAEMGSDIAVNEYIARVNDPDPRIRAAALNALASSGSPLAMPVLSKAAKDVLYRWEPTGASEALLNYAEKVGSKGDLKTMDKICKLFMAKANDKLSVQNSSRALAIYAALHGTDAMKEIKKAASSPDKSYRNAAFRASLALQGKEITKQWTDYFPKAIPAAKPEIIAMLGERRDETALQLVTASLSSGDKGLRTEAAHALAMISGSKAVPAIIEYLRKYPDAEDQQAAREALIFISGDKETGMLVPVVREGPEYARATAIGLLARSKVNEYFSLVRSFTSSDDENVRSAAYKALADLAGPDDQLTLIDLIRKTANSDYIADVQAALASAAAKIPDPEKRSDVILKAMGNNEDKEKLIPVLAKTGGRTALKTVLHEFENGNAGMRDICFATLTSWKDYTASSALYEICSSGNKTFEEPAFRAYVSQIRGADLNDDQKLLAYRKIMPYALSAERKNSILNQVAALKTYQALFFAAGFLDDPSTSPAAAGAVMTIALPPAGEESGMYGRLVREILEKASGKLTGPESDYEREMIAKYLSSMPSDEGFKPMFNGKDLTGWQGLVENPIVRSKMKKADLARRQAEANTLIPASWSVKDGCIWFNGTGDNLCSVDDYGDFELLVDWKITKGGDSGIYLRGSPQVQIWDTSRTNVGAQVGSGGLYNNQVNASKPLMVADNPVGDWNSFRILMIGENVSVWLNGHLVVDNVVLENYWDRRIPIFPRGPIELQAHGTDLAFRDIYVREITDKDYNLTPEEKAEGFVSLFNGRNLDGWVGNKQSYVAEDGMIVIKPESGSGGNLYTEREYSDFIFRFEFQLTPAANNGLGIRAPLEGDAAYAGMELQILDNTAEVYSKLQPYQYHGSVYGVIPAKRGYLRPVGEWNYQEVVAKGTRIKVTLNGTVILDGDIAGPRDKGTMDKNDHPGLRNKTGHIGFLGHGSVVRFRNIRIKDL
jgi:HEAT repeat protein